MDKFSKKEPVKIIFRYKNNNGAIQYHTYIYLGEISNEVNKILNKIKNEDLFRSLDLLNVGEIKTLEDNFGENWYSYFFNIHHISYTIDEIKNNQGKLKKLKSKLSIKWITQHVDDYKLIEETVSINYYDKIKKDLIRKNKQLSKAYFGSESETMTDFRTYKMNLINKRDMGKAKLKYEMNYAETDEISKSGDESKEMIENSLNKNKMEGGDYDSVDALEDDVDDDDFDEEKEDENNTKNSDDDDELELDQELEDIDKLYEESDAQVDKNIKKTMEMIKKVTDDENIFKRAEKSIINFNNGKDDSVYDEEIHLSVSKDYITSQYIKKDDTIKLIKDKICSTIKNNKKFGENSYILPSRQYLWSEYYYKNNFEKIMIGQKWITKSDMIKLDVETNRNIKVYENLRDNLRFLKDILKKSGGRIKREDNEYYILDEYEGYYVNNELYMSDVYNEFGIGYSPEPDDLKNVIDVYLRIYFPKLISDTYDIIDYLNGKTQNEEKKMIDTFDTIQNDLLLDNEIIKNVEEAMSKKKYKMYSGENYITQCFIHANLINKFSSKLEASSKIDLYKIWDKFKTSEKYPFVQYQTIDGKISYKYNEIELKKITNNDSNLDILKKWFENSPYGINFKVKTSNNLVGEDNDNYEMSMRYTAVNLSESGRIDYKTNWREDEKATFSDVNRSYVLVKKIIKKINDENEDYNFKIPDDDDFKYAFINSIQKFELPDKFTINHNDLSDFARYFYPYVAVVIEPRKRESKGRLLEGDEKKGKYGTYLRYKLISNYENYGKLEQRIIYLMKNYDYTEKKLIEQVSKEFNISDKNSKENIDKIKEKFPKLRKSRKILKKMENIPKNRPPGIDINIQGRTRDKYKIRVTGSRSRKQLNDINEFVNVLIYYYIEIYLLKNKEKQIMRDTLKQLSHIAKRRNRVEDVQFHSDEKTTMRDITNKDKRRLGFTPGEGENHWSRICPHSGDKYRRRPSIISNEEELFKNGFKYDKSKNFYTKIVNFKNKKTGKTEKVEIKALPLPSMALGEIENTVYYTCSQKENNEYIHVGFLTKSKNKYNLCMPCCFSKDQHKTKNKDLFENCISGKSEKKEESVKELISAKRDILYILQDTNKLQDLRLGMLSNHLNFLFNRHKNGKMLKIEMKDRYLLKTDGIYFKMGSYKNDQYFLNTLALCLEIEVANIIKKMVKFLSLNKNSGLFTSLNNGNLKNVFDTVDNYVKYLNTNDNLSFEVVNNLMSIPGVLNENGINFVIFKKISRKKNNYLDKYSNEDEEIYDDYLIECQNVEDVNNLKKSNRDCLIMIKDEKYYNPIVLVIKERVDNKDVIIKKIHNYDENDENNVVNKLIDYYQKNCKIDKLLNDGSYYTAKYVKKIIDKSSDFNLVGQVVDLKNKCKYLILDNNAIIPVVPSGCIYDLNIYSENEIKLLSLDNAIIELKKIKKKMPKLKVDILGVLVNILNEDSAYVNGIITEMELDIPIKGDEMLITDLYKKGLIVEERDVDDVIDNKLSNKNNFHKADERVKLINIDEFENESYEVFRMSLSDTLKIDNKLKKKINEIKNMESPEIKESELLSKIKKYILESFLFYHVDYEIYGKDKKLHNLHLNTLKNLEISGSSDLIIQNINKIISSDNDERYNIPISLSKNIPNLDNYLRSNYRKSCINNQKIKCNDNIYCEWNDNKNKCGQVLTIELIIKFVKKISNEIINNDQKYREIFNIGDNKIFDIIDYNEYTERDDENVVKTSNLFISRELEKLFGKNKIPNLMKKYKRTGKKENDEVLANLNYKNPILNMGDYFIQNVYNDNLSYFRAIANGFYWNEKKNLSTNIRNLGYLSNLQTIISEYLRSKFIDWIKDENNFEKIKNELKININHKKTISLYLNKIFDDVILATNGSVELFVIQNIIKRDIIVINENGDTLFKYGTNSGEKISLHFHDIDKKNIPHKINVVLLK